ncbi:MAG: YihY/virulence factor BrkB family protein [Bacteroidia bacterium]|nr:YihY/virulence factor BrkB family protein [Bacteroidia bacterium]
MKRSGKERMQQALTLLRDFLSLHWVRDTFMYFIRIVERMEQNHIFLSAAGLSFNVLLCFIPLVLLVFYALGFYLGTEDAIATVDRSIQDLGLFPYEREQLRGMVIDLIREFVGGSQLAGLIGALGLIWTSSALFGALRTVLGRIFHVEDTRSIFASKLRDFAMLSVVGIAVILVTVFMYGVSMIKGLGQKVFGLELESFIFNDVLNALIPFVLSFLLFLIVFTIVPDKRQRFRVVLIASSIAALLWGLAKFAFSYYLQHLWKIGMIYGPYAVLVATALWVYYSSLALLFAAEVGQMYDERRRLRKLFTEKSLTRVVERSRETTLRFPTHE